MDKLTEIEERWAKATPGPWRSERPRFVCVNDAHYPPGKKCDRETGLGWHVPAGSCRLEFRNWEEGYYEIWATPEIMVAGIWDYDVGGVKEEKNIDAIAAAPSDIAWLIAEMKRLLGDINEFVWLFGHEPPNDLGTYTQVMRKKWCDKRDALLAIHREEQWQRS